MMNIQHIKYDYVLQSRLFHSIKSYDDMQKAIIAHGKRATCVGKDKCTKSDCLHVDTYENRIGWTFEVYCEAFLRRYGMRGEKSPNYIEAGHSLSGTSADPYHSGYDYAFTTGDNNIALV